MKKNLGSSLLLALAFSALVFSIVDNPPGGVRWGVFAAEPASLPRKLTYLLAIYFWPGLLSCLAISLFQLQARLASSGANKRTVFSLCVLASGAMLLSLRMMAYSPNSGTAYVAGMALGYTMMGRLYAVRLRTFPRGIRLPWPVWRGNMDAVQQIDAMTRARTGSPAAR
jgi:hypothetical protein